MLGELACLFPVVLPGIAFMHQMNTESDLSELQPFLYVTGKKRPEHQLVCDIWSGWGDGRWSRASRLPDPRLAVSMLADQSRFWARKPKKFHPELIQKPMHLDTPSIPGPDFSKPALILEPLLQ